MCLYMCEFDKNINFIKRIQLRNIPTIIIKNKNAVVNGLQVDVFQIK